jgi:hypothetical protein
LTKIGFYHRDCFPGWEKAGSYLTELIDRFSVRSVMEIGSGPNPTLALDVVHRRLSRYLISDVDASELQKAPRGYERRVTNLETESPPDLEAKLDLVFSRMVNEHVKDGKSYHSNIFHLLRPGGFAVHCSASLYTLPFLINKFAPERACDVLLDFFAPRNVHTHARFRAHYDWCRGPTRRQIARFEALGYEVLEFNGYFGHRYYRERLPGLHFIEMKKSKLLLKHPVPHLCSYILLILRKPASN